MEYLKGMDKTLCIVPGGGQWGANSKVFLFYIFADGMRAEMIKTTGKHKKVLTLY